MNGLPQAKVVVRNLAVRQWMAKRHRFQTHVLGTPDLARKEDIVALALLSCWGRGLGNDVRRSGEGLLCIPQRDLNFVASVRESIAVRSQLPVA